ncbi:MAG: AraC family transcriptional regulator [Oscillospiraceae bacterium]|nr:AraC family transcriptional regulator [Oscillospiraceae bacterium]
MIEENAIQDFAQVNERVALLENLLSCGDQVTLWVYASDLHIIRANTEKLVLSTLFERSGCLAYMKTHFETESVPLILSSHLGLMWCAVQGVFSNEDGLFGQYYVVGPVVNVDLSVETIREAMNRFHLDPGWRSGFADLMRKLPVVPSTLFFQYALMLHYCVTGEKLRRSELAFQKSEELSRSPQKGPHSHKTKTDRFLTYQMEQQILDNVRYGNLDYTATLEKAYSISNGVRISTGNPLQQAILSTVIFTTLCTRAAIEGGLSPDTAYALGDSYIQNLTACTNITDGRAINHAMYEDFIQRVHRLRRNPNYSKQIQSCIDYIELHLTEELSIRRLAQRVGYTEYYLSHKFKEETGSSIANYIRYVRIERAKSLLTATDQPVNKIAEQLHFCSSSYFSSKFEEIVGMLPTQYRKEKQRL